ncbi:MAG: FAD-dependent oxidoreductase [Microvirga sp.]|nr:FAD-dependent oxidoreductase [Microvirga sp.]
MAETFDICVIGAGSGGLSVAAGAAQMGARVVLIEKGEMGGDCLNTGCVPSKALIAAAHAAHAGREAARFGVDYDPPRVDFARVHAHIHGVIAGIAPHDSVERFEGLGVRVIRGHARFVDAAHVDVDGLRIKARRFVVATGSRAALPPVPGLALTPHLTNETVFSLTQAPDRLAVIGGGPIGVELAQAFARLGARVTLLERFTILPRDEPEAVAMLRARLAAEGVDIRENVEIESVAGREGDVRVALKGGELLRVTHLLVAAGRSPNVEDLGLEAAGIEYDAKKGVAVDARLRTSNRSVFAIGDVAGGPQFTHIAGYHAGIVIRNALFMLPAKVDYSALPWVTYADPELAHVGLTEAQAREAGHEVRTLTEPLAGNDRARAEARTEGLTKIVLDKGGRILGATILAPGAGEQIGVWGLAISRRMKISAIAGLILPYPTMAETGKRAAGSWFTPSLYGPRVRRLVGLTQRFLP